MHDSRDSPNLSYHPTFVIEKGRRWWKVLKTNNCGRSAEYFFDPKTGELREAAGWAAPRHWVVTYLATEGN